mmetsp:Transcript_32038/g.77753  ORF Transcript_32038/g.77753 Transcript_32038/m.77753 type:complete len:228 (-) Transcript_32038:270-953(-)
MSKEQSLCVLCIGNSLTYYNGGLDTYLCSLGFAARRYARPGASLSELWRDRGAAKAIDEGYTREKGWDFVVLQEDLPETTVDAFTKSSSQFIERVRAKGAQPVMLLAWPYERLGECKMDDILTAHRNVANRHAVRVAPVGLAFSAAARRARELGDVGTLDLLCPDDEHPSVQGSYLQAIVVAAILSGLKATEGSMARWKPSNLEEGLDDFFRDVADEAISQWYACAP